MKRNFILSFALIIFQFVAKAQVEEVHVFYVDLSSEYQTSKSYIDQLTQQVRGEIKKVATNAINNNAKVIFYIPKGSNGTVDTIERKITSKLNQLFTTDDKYTLDFEYDAKFLRNILYTYNTKYNKFLSLNFHFVLSSHSANNLFFEYNPLINLFLDEVTYQLPFSDQNIINFYIVNKDKRIDWRVRERISKNNIDQHLAFFNFDSRFKRKYSTFNFFEF
jgi:hypothetical protein